MVASIEDIKKIGIDNFYIDVEVRWFATDRRTGLTYHLNRDAKLSRIDNQLLQEQQNDE